MGDKTISERTLRVNKQIKAREIFLIGDDGEPIGNMELRKALEAAEEASMDLVELNPNADPPVCRIMDYGKYEFQLNKKRGQAKKKQKQAVLKEIEFSIRIEKGDFQVKLRKIKEFIENGDKVKITIRFRGREISHQELGFEIANRLQAEMDEFAQLEQTPRFEGRQIVMVACPKKAKV